jgi:hypothetical protein
MTAPIRSMPELIDDRFEVYRVVTDYEALREGFIDRAEDLNVTRLALDEAGGFTGGHSAKILCTPPIKDLGKVSLGKMLKATGMALVLVIDDERFAPVKATMAKRKKTMRAVARIRRVKGLFTKENAGKYGKKRWDGITPEIRKKIMRKVAKARWKQRRRAGASLISQNSASCADGQSPPIA